MAKDEIEKLIALGYCRTSNKHRIVSRIDRPDWKEFLVKERLENVVNSRGAEDFYRRVYSKDNVIIDTMNNYRKFPQSMDTITGYREESK